MLPADRLPQIKAYAAAVYRDWRAAHSGQEKTPETEAELYVTMVASVRDALLREEGTPSRGVGLPPPLVELPMSTGSEAGRV